jgi:hypothetical protein
MRILPSNGQLVQLCFCSTDAVRSKRRFDFDNRTGRPIKRVHARGAAERNSDTRAPTLSRDRKGLFQVAPHWLPFSTLPDARRCEAWLISARFSLSNSPSFYHCYALYNRLQPKAGNVRNHVFVYFAECEIELLTYRKKKIRADIQSNLKKNTFKSVFCTCPVSLPD